jgi:hypothetical protein
MLLTSLLPLLAQYWPLVLVSLLAAFLLNNKYWNGLQKYPGPPLAAYTNWYRFFSALNRRHEHEIIALHRKHGDIVRLGPNVLSFADPRAIKEIYGLNKGMVKSDFYPVQNAVSKGRRLQSLFSTTDEGYHAKYRRCVNNAFAMSSLVNYEPLVSSTLGVFLEKTEERFCKNAGGNGGEVCDFGTWLQYFAFDVIGDLTWSTRLGFVEEGRDVDGIVAFLKGFLSYAGPVSVIIFLLLLSLSIGAFLTRIRLDKCPSSTSSSSKTQSLSFSNVMESPKLSSP